MPREVESGIPRKPSAAAGEEEMGQSAEPAEYGNQLGPACFNDDRGWEAVFGRDCANASLLNQQTMSLET